MHAYICTTHTFTRWQHASESDTTKDKRYILLYHGGLLSALNKTIWCGLLRNNVSKINTPQSFKLKLVLTHELGDGERHFKWSLKIDFMFIIL